MHRAGPSALEIPVFRKQSLHCLFIFFVRVLEKVAIFRLSEHVNDSEVSERFAMLLLRYLELGTVRSEDTIHSLFITVSRMIPSTSDASKYLPLVF